MRAEALLCLPALLLLALAGCAPHDGPHPIAAGTPCAACGMGIEDMRYACETGTGKAVRVYDSIECLLGAGPPPARAWLADYDTRALHAAESLWVVKADIPSPMGGGYAAFVDRGAADEIAGARGGRVARLAEFAAGTTADSVAGRP
jgi:nitrous oxide reductase accessory protein NosL